MRRPRYLIIGSLPVRSGRQSQERGLNSATFECDRAGDCRILVAAVLAQQLSPDASPQRNPQPAPPDSGREKSRDRSASERSEDPKEDSAFGLAWTSPNRTKTRRGSGERVSPRLPARWPAVGVGLR